MGAFADLSEVVNRITGGNSGLPQNIFFYKDARVGAAAAAATVAARMSSLWQYNGVPSDGAVASTSVETPTNATNGGLKQVDPTGGRELWMLGVVAAASQPGTLILYDRLLQISGLSGTTTTAQTVGGSLTRYTNGLGNQIWLEITTAIGTTATTIIATYTDQDGNTGQTTPLVAIGGTGLNGAQRIIPLTLAAGDYGVQACASVDLTATTGTAGNFTAMIVHPLLYIPIPAIGNGQPRDLIAGLPAITEIETDACLAWAWLAQGTTAPQIHGSVHMAER